MDAVQQASRPPTREHAVIVPLRGLGAGALPEAGGKAANLGELIGAGFPVPDGFCVSTGAYRDVADAAGLSEIVEELAGLPDPDRAAELARRARDRIPGA
jgi:rifampicin phosphotransferase